MLASHEIQDLYYQIQSILFAHTNIENEYSTCIFIISCLDFCDPQLLPGWMTSPISLYLSLGRRA